MSRGNCGDGIDIDRLTAQDDFSVADLLVVWSRQNQDPRRISGQVLLDFIAANTASAAAMVTQYSAPTTGLTVTIAQVNGVSVPVWLSLTPAGTLATLTVDLPPSGTAVDRQEVLVTCTQIISALTVSATGLTVSAGAPSSMAAYGAFRMKFDGVTNTWIRVSS